MNPSTRVPSNKNVKCGMERVKRTHRRELFSLELMHNTIVLDTTATVRGGGGGGRTIELYASRLQHRTAEESIVALRMPYSTELTEPATRVVVVAGKWRKGEMNERLVF